MPAHKGALWIFKNNMTKQLEKRCSSKALELSFSTKMGLTKSSREAWISEAIKKTGIETIEIPECLGKCQRMVINLIYKQKNKLLYRVLSIKYHVKNTEHWKR